jgi:hypothetical protein
VGSGKMTKERDESVAPMAGISMPVLVLAI